MLKQLTGVTHDMLQGQAQHEHECSSGSSSSSIGEWKGRHMSNSRSGAWSGRAGERVVLTAAFVREFGRDNVGG